MAGFGCSPRPRSGRWRRLAKILFAKEHLGNLAEPHTRERRFDVGQDDHGCLQVGEVPHGSPIA
jgi:hypothetical protein